MFLSIYRRDRADRRPHTTVRLRLNVANSHSTEHDTGPLCGEPSGRDVAETREQCKEDPEEEVGFGNAGGTLQAEARVSCIAGISGCLRDCDHVEPC